MQKSKNEVDNYSNSAGWIFAGVFMGFLAIIVGGIIDYSNNNSSGRLIAAIKGTLIQVGLGIVFAACGAV